MNADNSLTSAGKFVQSLPARIANMRGWRAHVLALGAGAAGVLGFAPFHIWPISLLSLVVLIWLMDGAHATSRPMRAGAARAFSFAYGQFFAGLYWIGSAFISRGPEYIPYMPFALIFLMAGLALIWGIAGFCAMRFWCIDSRRIAIFALFFFAAEWVRGHFLTGFPWNLPGMVWVPGGAISQSVSLYGVWGLSFLTLYAFAAPAALIGKNEAAWRRALPLVLSVLAFVGIVSFGVDRLKNPQTGEQEGVRLRVVQADIDQREKWKPENREAVLEQYLQLSTQASLDGISHVIWPEGALPTLLLEDTEALDRLAEAFSDDAVLITGLTRRERAANGEILFRNSLIAFNFEGIQPRVETVYDKHHLVPFGEFMPFGKTISKLGVESLAVLGDGFTPGPAASSMKIANLPIFSPQICYEIAYSGFTPRGEGRPEWILNISNDSWFGSTTGPFQHLDQARFRAIEEGVPVVRAASSGITGVIDTYGRMHLRVGKKANRAADTALPLPQPPTMNRRLGGWFIVLMTGLLLFYCLLCRRR